MSLTSFPVQGASSSNPANVQFGGNQVDAFGRLRTSTPYTLFDSQARYAADSSFSYSTASGATTAYNTNQSSGSLNVTTTSGSTAMTLPAGL